MPNRYKEPGKKDMKDVSYTTIAHYPGYDD
jgi:hypothetical protein